MGIIKLSKQNEKYLLMNTLDKRDNLVKDVCITLQQSAFEGVVPFELREAKGRKVIVCDVSTTYSILTRLQTPIDSRELVLILKGLLDSVKSLSSRNISPEYVDLDLDYIFIRRDGSVLLTVWAVNDIKQKATLPQLLKEIGNKAKPNSKRDKNFIEGYLDLFSDGTVNTTLDKLDKFVMNSYEMLKENSMKSAIKTASESKSAEIPKSRRKNEPIVEETVGSDTLNDLESEDDEEEVLTPTNKTTFLMGDDDDDYDDGDKTSILGGSETLSVRRFLFQESTKESFEIEGGETIIGKKDADIEVTGNKAISRKHAKIIIFDDLVTIQDLESSNGTYVNDIRLDSGDSEQITDGDTIKLANEVFTYSEE